jgi:phosphate starvation-inducible protein PhoH and related proteins
MGRFCLEATMSRRRREKGELNTETPVDHDLPRPRRVAALESKTDNQTNYISAIQANTLTFGTGPAGTGKTFIATTMAADALQKKHIKKILLTRPAIEAGEKLGYLPGELDEKFEPYLRPFRDILNKRLGHGFVDCALKNGKIEALPLAYMRGMTFEDCWVLLDEAQNTTPVQMKMFLTRIGDRCKVIVNGDLTQQDIPGASGLADGLQRSRGLPGVGEVAFTRDDVVRSGLVQMLVDRYSGPTELPLDEGVIRTLRA